MSDNAQIYMLGRNMFERMSESDLAMLCVYLQAADYRYGDLNANLQRDKMAAVTQIIEYSRKRGLLPVLTRVLGQYYRHVLNDAPTAGFNPAATYQPMVGVPKPQDYDPELAEEMAEFAMQQVNGQMLAQARRVSRWGCIFSLLLMLAIFGGMGYFLWNELGFSFTMLGQPLSRMDSPAAVQMLSPSDGWMAGTTYNEGGFGDVLLLHCVGDKWEKLSGLGKGQLNALAMVSPTEGWAVGANTGPEGTSSLMLHYHNGQWTRLDPGASNTALRTVFMLSADEGWAAGQSYGLTPNLLHYTGGKWQAVTVTGSSTVLSINSIYMLNVGRGWAVGDGGTILEYRDGKWQPNNSPTHRSLNSVFMLSADEGWAVGDSGAILHYQHGEWAATDVLSTYYNLTSVAFSGGEGWAGGGDSLLLHYQNGVWQQVNPSIGKTSFDMTGLSLTAAGEGWASGRYGNVLRLKGGAWSRFYSNLSRRVLQYGYANSGAKI